MEDVRDVPAKLWLARRAQRFVDRTLANRRVDEARARDHDHVAGRGGDGRERSHGYAVLGEHQEPHAPGTARFDDGAELLDELAEVRSFDALRELTVGLP
ncbi:hypothetical protein [Sorangium sp. So ce124]|uniref:hypothetical protein n=1 Tax=Sorangium sp. So ce124 TaxID=3133280 RepID=UPI003F613AF8